MTFLSPVALLGLLLVSLPVAIHLLVRRRGVRLDFPSLRFLRETPSFKLYPRSLRQPLLLALRVAAVVLLVLGLARPILTFKSRTPEAVRFILMDASLSMKTRGRAEAAREQARALINKLASGERAAVIALSSEATVLAELTTDKERLLEAVGRYQPKGGAVNYDAGFAAVLAQLQPEPRVAAEADLISDFQQSGLQTRPEIIYGEAAPLRLAAYPVGSEIERNAFLVDAMVRKTERGLELMASEIAAETDGRSGARRAWTIDRDEDTRPGVEWRTRANGQVTGRLEVLGPDEFDADDETYFAITPPRESRILLIEDKSDASLYLRAALEASAGTEESKNFTVERRAAVPERAADLASFQLIVATLHGAPREDEVRTLLEYARGGGTLWLYAGRDLDAAAWSRFAGEGPRIDLPFEQIARRSGSSPLTFGAMDALAPPLRGLDESARASLGAVRASEAFAVTPRASSDTLVRWSDGTPAFISMNTGEGTILLMATSAERASSDLGLSSAFPALASSVMRAAATTREPLAQTIGEPIRLNVLPETEVKITSAEGRASMTKARELVRHSVDYFAEPGIYQLEFAGQQKFMAFNAPASESERQLANEDEVRRRLPIGDGAAEGARAGGESSLREATERSSWTWRYLLAAAFLLMIAELFVAMKRRKPFETLSE